MQAPWANPDRSGTFFAASAGVFAGVAGIVLLATGDSAAGAALLLVGVFLWALAGTTDRWEGLAFKLLGNSLEAKLSKKPHGDEFADAAKDAPDSALEAVIPLLREDVASDVIEVGQALDGKRLIDPELSWLRQELKVTVFAINRPGDGEKWTGGGRISDMPLPAGTKLAVLGEQSDVASAGQRIAS
jgi:hypothetical protein